MSKVRDIVDNIEGASTSPVVTNADITSSTPIAGSNVELVSGVSKDLLGIGGAGYSWVDETANRVLGTTYTNTNGKPIQIAITTVLNADTKTIEILVDGVVIIRQADGDNTHNTQISSVVIVQNGSTYTVNGEFSKWFELK